MKVFKEYFHTPEENNDDVFITKEQLIELEDYLNTIFREHDIDIDFQLTAGGRDTHFYQRLNDPRNIEPITLVELKDLFVKASNKYGKLLSKHGHRLHAVFRQLSTKINIPFVIEWDAKYSQFILTPKTIMRKDGFVAPPDQPVLNLESYRLTKKDIIDFYRENF